MDKPWSQVSSLLPPGSCLQLLSRIGFSNPTARRCFHRVLLTHAEALALSASQFVHEQKSPRIFTSMHLAGFELTKLTYTRLEDNLIHHRGYRLLYTPLGVHVCCLFFEACRLFLLLSRLLRPQRRTNCLQSP